MGKTVADSKQLRLSSSSIEIDARMIVLESCVLLALLSVTLWSVGPLLEEWGLLHAFNEYGIAYLGRFAAEIPMRPLHLVPAVLQWVAGNGKPVGVAIAACVTMVARYLVARWAVSPLLASHDRWIIAVLAAVLALWPGVWFGRYGAAQFSALLFFAALGFAIRLSRQWSVGVVIGCSVSIMLLLATYQGLALCLVLIPFASFLWRGIGDREPFNWRSRAAAAARVSLGVGLGFAVYAIYCLLISSAVGSGGYESALAEDSRRLFTMAGISTHIASAFTTAYLKQPYLLPAYLLLTYFLCLQGIDKLNSIGSRLWVSIGIFVLLLLLPLLSTIYVSAAHINDPDRVLYPVSTGLVLVCISLLSALRDEGGGGDGTLSSIVVFIILISSFVVSLDARAYVQIQVRVIDQAMAAVEDVNAKGVLIRDMTGTLGDVYTLYDSSLSAAMAVRGKSISAVICTPLAIDRIHPVAQRFPIPSTARCEDSPAAAGTLSLTARWKNGEVVLDK